MMKFSGLKFTRVSRRACSMMKFSGPEFTRVSRGTCSQEEITRFLIDP